MSRRDDELFDEPTPYPHELTNHPDDEARLHAARTRQANREPTPTSATSSGMNGAGHDQRGSGCGAGRERDE